MKPTRTIFIGQPLSGGEARFLRRLHSDLADTDALILANFIAGERQIDFVGVRHPQAGIERGRRAAGRGDERAELLHAVIEAVAVAVDELVGPRVGAARIEAYDDDIVRIATDSPGAALLVLSDTYYPGWRAFVDGAKHAHRSSASSWQEDVASGRSPDAARAPADEAAYPGAAPAKARISPGAHRRIEDLFSGPASGLLHHPNVTG